MKGNSLSIPKVHIPVPPGEGGICTKETDGLNYA